MLSLTTDLKTPYHRMSAGGKLLLLCFATMGLYVFDQIVVQVGVLCAVVALYLVPSWAFSRLGARMLWRLWPMIVVLGAFHALWGDIGHGAVVMLRLVNAISLASLVTLTTPLRDIQAVLDWLLRPLAAFGWRVERFSLTIALMIRFVPHILTISDRLTDSWRLRSARSPSWRIVFPILIGVLEDADHVSDALRARGGM